MGCSQWTFNKHAVKTARCHTCSPTSSLCCEPFISSSKIHFELPKYGINGLHVMKNRPTFLQLMAPYPHLPTCSVKLLQGTGAPACLDGGSGRCCATVGGSSSFSCGRCDSPSSCRLPSFHHDHHGFKKNSRNLLAIIGVKVHRYSPQDLSITAVVQKPAKTWELSDMKCFLQKVVLAIHPCQCQWHTATGIVHVRPMHG